MRLPTILDRTCRRALRMVVALVLALAGVAGLAGASRADILIGFDEFSLTANSCWSGADGSGGFTSQGAYFNNVYDHVYGSWSGWAYSNVNNTTDPGYGNQYAAYAGTGVGGSGNYAVAYVGDPTYGGVLPTVTISAGMQVESAMVTNTTLAALSMGNGDEFAKKFGPSDWFLLTITGEGASNNVLGSVGVYLADNGSILNAWKSVDLGSLSAAKKLVFGLISSDTGLYGMNTPAYFAMDNLRLSVVPEPSTFVMLGIGILAGAYGISRKRRLPIRYT
jgi:hypothetical protein